MRACWAARMRHDDERRAGMNPAWRGSMTDAPPHPQGVVRFTGTPSGRWGGRPDEAQESSASPAPLVAARADDPEVKRGRDPGDWGGRALRWRCSGAWW